MSLSELFNEDDAPEPEGPPFVVDTPAPVEVIPVVKKTPKLATKPVVTPNVVPAVSHHPMTEERAAQRFNTILRRFLYSGYNMEVMLGKFCVRRGEKRVTGKWHGSFMDAIDEVTPEIMAGANYDDIGKTPYHEIGELKTLMKELLDARDGNDRPYLTVGMQNRIEEALKEH